MGQYSVLPTYVIKDGDGNVKTTHRNRLLLLEQAMAVTDLLARHGHVNDHRTRKIATDSVMEDVSTVAEKETGNVNPKASSGLSYAAKFCQKFDSRSWLDQALWPTASVIRNALIKDG